MIGAAGTLLGGIVAKWLDGRTKQLAEQLKNEAALMQTIVGRQEAIEFQLAAAMRREGEMSQRIRHLENEVKDRDMAVRELTWRYDALKEQYIDLNERHKQAEKDNMRLREELLKSYLESAEALRSLPAPPPTGFRP